MTVGPTLHYSHSRVQQYWLLSCMAFALSCLFWSKIQSSSFFDLDLRNVTGFQFWSLGSCTINPVSIFEYPWQILVLGLLMGTLAVVPVLVSQLMSFWHSIPLVLSITFLADLPGFSISVLVSCFAAACRPLRFRSRFIAIALCTAPQLFYWGCFGGARGLEPVKFGFSFTPWFCAWLIGLSTAAVVITIGHFNRYRPGLTWMATAVTLVAAVVVFRTKIGFDELDYQIYVAKNAPDQITEFHDHSITEALDQTITNPAVKKYLAGFFYPSEPIALRTELKKEIQNQLGMDRWPSWFIVPVELRYQLRKQQLFEQYDLFITRRSRSRRMPIALYYKAILSEYSPDIETIGQKETLHFYSDYPFERSRDIWYRLYGEFDSSVESIEARWRIASHWAGQGRFQQADEIISEAQKMAAEHLKLLENRQTQKDSFFSPFSPPARSAMTAFRLTKLQMRLAQLRNLISSHNRSSQPASAERLARFIMLNPHSRDYSRRLDELISQIQQTDPLYDNILLAQTLLIADEHLRSERLADLNKKFKNTDGGMQALYELALLKINLWRQQSDANPLQKKKYLDDARNVLTSFMNIYPESTFTEQVKKNLEDLPAG